MSQSFDTLKFIKHCEISRLGRSNLDDEPIESERVKNKPVENNIKDTCRFLYLKSQYIVFIKFHYCLSFVLRITHCIYYYNKFYTVRGIVRNVESKV